MTNNTIAVLNGPLIVVAAALIDPHGRILVQQCAPGKMMAGLWEFPGGKIESGETPEAALVRELHEELGISVAPSSLSPAGFASAALADRHLLLLLYICRDWRGQVQALDAVALHWADIAGLRQLAMPPADAPLIDLLALQF